MAQPEQVELQGLSRHVKCVLLGEYLRALKDLQRAERQRLAAEKVALATCALLRDSGKHDAALELQPKLNELAECGQKLQETAKRLAERFKDCGIATSGTILDDGSDIGDLPESFKQNVASLWLNIGLQTT